MDLDCKELERLKELVPYKILALTPNEIINYIEQLQSNWNSLREYIGEEWYCFDNESVEHEVAKNILNKMNELEKRNKNE